VSSGESEDTVFLCFIENAISIKRIALSLLLILVLSPSLLAQKYMSFQEAWSVGVTRHNKRMFTESRAPFEAVFKLSETDNESSVQKH
jgi:hypothetical protein